MKDFSFDKRDVLLLGRFDDEKAPQREERRRVKLSLGSATKTMEHRAALPTALRPLGDMKCDQVGAEIGMKCRLKARVRLKLCVFAVMTHRGERLRL